MPNTLLIRVCKHNKDSVNLLYQSHHSFTDYSVQNNPETVLRISCTVHVKNCTTRTNSSKENEHSSKCSPHTSEENEHSPESSRHTSEGIEHSSKSSRHTSDKSEHSLRSSCHTSEKNEHPPAASHHNSEKNEHSPETSVYILLSSVSMD